MSEQQLAITRYSIQSHITIENPGPNQTYISHTILLLEGGPSAPYTLSAVIIKFVPDGKLLAEPSWQDPILSCEKHRSEYEAIIDMVNKGIDNNNPPTKSFTAHYILEHHRLVLMLT